MFDLVFSYVVRTNWMKVKRKLQLKTSNIKGKYLPSYLIYLPYMLRWFTGRSEVKNESTQQKGTDQHQWKGCNTKSKLTPRDESERWVVMTIIEITKVGTRCRIKLFGPRKIGRINHQGLLSKKFRVEDKGRGHQAEGWQKQWFSGKDNKINWS